MEKPSCCLVIRAAMTGRPGEQRRCNRFDLMLQPEDAAAVGCQLLIQPAQGLPYFAGPNLGVYLLPSGKLREGNDSLIVVLPTSSCFASSR